MGTLIIGIENIRTEIKNDFEKHFKKSDINVNKLQSYLHSVTNEVITKDNYLLTLMPSNKEIK